MKIFGKIYRFVTILFLYTILCATCVHAFDLDMTVDDDIRKNYNSSKLKTDTKTLDLDELPDLPEILKDNSIDNKTYESDNITQNLPKQSILNGIKISKGTSFSVLSTSKISDWQTAGTSVKFKTSSPVYKRKYTIPSSTVFSGEIVESHQPQLSCNGGLVVIRINSMQYKGNTIPLRAYITRANDKIIFLNNIKGERTYLKTTWQKGSWGRSMFGKMTKLSSKLCSDASTVVLCPFPFVYGVLCAGANTAISPITAFFSKGGHVSIPSGSSFKIKLLEDAYIN